MLGQKWHILESKSSRLSLAAVTWLTGDSISNRMFTKRDETGPRNYHYVHLRGPLQLLWVGWFITQKEHLYLQKKKRSPETCRQADISLYLHWKNGCVRVQLHTDSLLWRGHSGPSVFISLCRWEPERRCANKILSPHLPPTYRPFSSPHQGWLWR